MNKILKYSLFVFISILLFSCNNDNQISQANYIKNAGFAHGTTYHITYQSDTNLIQQLEQQMHNVDKSLSTFDSLSTISRVSKNDTNVVLDTMFIKVFNKAKQVYTKTNGAFDLTVANLVNAWGFGFEKFAGVDTNFIDSLLQYVGFDKINIVDGKIIKQNKNIKLDASAIAKGYSVDVVSMYLESQGVKNYLVEIGGEVRTKGFNQNGQVWRIGIDKPIDDSLAIDEQIQQIIQLSGKAIATSGDYRKFYYKNGIKYSHTINPKTGFPVNHNLLGVSVIAQDCMTADAFATGFMVLGVDKSIEIAKKDTSIDVFLIYSDKNDSLCVKMTDGFKKYLVE